jgi:hypothetical protein
MVRMKIGGHPTDLKVDTGADHSVVTQPVGPLSNKHTLLLGLQRMTLLPLPNG